MVSPWNVNGHFKFELFENDIYLTVYPPSGEGNRIELEDVLAEVMDWEDVSVDLNLISQVVSQMTGNPVRIGEIQVTQKKNRVLVEITHDGLKAYITLGQAVDIREIEQELKYNGVVHNIDYGIITDIIKEQRFNKPILIAQASLPINGQDAQLEFNFNKDKIIHLKMDEHGKVDFKEIGIINPVKTGQVLVIKHPATNGVPGMTVLGCEMPARNGIDISLPIGNNTIPSSDELSLLSQIDGHAIYRNNQVDVEPVLVINGDVDYEIGNIDFPGSVMIKGNVLDGFEVKSSGNIQIKGYVERANIKAAGDIIVEGGIIGKSKGMVQAKGSIFANFVEYGNLEAEEDIIINESIRYSKTDAKKRVIVQGHIGAILGGRVRAGEEVNAKSIGSLTETETIIETGSLPLVRNKIKSLQKELESDEEKIKGIEQGIKYLLNLKEKLGVNFPNDKEKLLVQHIEAKNSLKEKLYTMSMALPLLESDVYRAKEGKICAYKIIYPGVKLTIRNASMVIKEEYKFVTFSIIGDEITSSPYEPPRGVKIEVESPAKNIATERVTSLLSIKEITKTSNESTRHEIAPGDKGADKEPYTSSVGPNFKAEDFVIKQAIKPPLVATLKVRLVSDPIGGVKMGKLKIGDEVVVKISDLSTIKELRDLLPLKGGGIIYARIEDIFTLDSSRCKVTTWLGAGILGETVVANKSRVKIPFKKRFIFR